MPDISVIICAAGRGERAGFGRNKLLAPLFGAPALYHTLKKFAIPQISEVIVTASAEDYGEIENLCAPFGYKTVLGGNTRSQSVKNALDKVSGGIVLIHDGARPFLTEKLILSCIAEVKEHGSAVPVLPFTDTAVCAKAGHITARIDRETLFKVQTPQGFFTCDIRRAYALSGDKSYTDDSAVYGEFISPPHVFDGEESNVKLTYKSDFPREYATLSAGAGEKIGFGVDVHAFCAGSFVTLAGVKIECGKALKAHSDGDVILHALTDALLTGAGLKDIGHYFPDNDEKYAGADSKKLLETALGYVKSAGYVPSNVCIAVQAEFPRLSTYVDEMRENIARICGIERKDVGLAAGTCEHLGFVGEGKGIAAYATVSLKKKG